MQMAPESTPRSHSGAAAGRKRVTSWVLLGVWFAGTIGALAYFQLRDQRSFEVARTARFDSQTRAAAAEAWLRGRTDAAAGDPRTVATVVHLFRAGCPCNRFTDSHRTEIAARYAPQGVRFLAAAAIEINLDWIDATP